jgi:hypothetical protein
MSQHGSLQQFFAHLVRSLATEYHSFLLTALLLHDRFQTSARHFPSNRKHVVPNDTCHVGFEVFVALVTKCSLLWDITSCRCQSPFSEYLVHSCTTLEEEAKKESSFKLLRNVCWILTDYIALKRNNSSTLVIFCKQHSCSIPILKTNLPWN